MSARPDKTPAWTRLCAALAAAAGLGLAGCETLPSLPDGRTTTLDPPSAALRAGLAVSTESLSSLPAYAPVEGCAYIQMDADPATPERAVWNVRPARDRLLVSMEAADGTVSTALIGPDGELFDFNLQDAGTGQRWSRETYGAMARERARQVGGHVLNDVERLLPHFETSAARYGSVVARVHDERGAVWGQYIYAGTANYQGRRVVILDLMRVLETQPRAGQVVVGFNLVDAGTGLPLLSILQLGYRYRLEQSGCS